MKDKNEAKEDLRKLLPEVLQFIHEARKVENNNVLVHCLQGISRSVTFVVAYLMVVTDKPWDKTLDRVRQKRTIANPNPEFQRLLFEFDKSDQKIDIQQMLKIDQEMMDRETQLLFSS